MITWGPEVETGYLPSPQLYDMSADNTEQANLAEENPRVVYDLERVLRLVRANNRQKLKALNAKP